jgi:hypothetical protein
MWRYPASVQEQALATVVLSGDPRANDSLYRAERDLANAINGLQGRVLIDTTYGFPTALAVADPKKLIIPSDTDFFDTLQNPAGRAAYLAVPDPAVSGPADMINRNYPRIFQEGRPWLEPVATFPGQLTWKLYRITGRPDVPAPGGRPSTNAGGAASQP